MSDIINDNDLTMLYGSRQDVMNQLSHSTAENLFVVQADHYAPEDFEQLAGNVGTITKAVGKLMSEHYEKRQLEKIVEVFVKGEVAKPHLLREAAMESKARKAVLESGEWLTAAEISELAGFSPRNPSAQPNKWKKQGIIFAIKHGNVDYYPAFALDKHAGYRPFKAMAKVLDILAAYKDGWGLAYWFQSANSFLGGELPQDMIATDPERVIGAALDEVEEVAHG